MKIEVNSKKVNDNRLLKNFLECDTNSNLLKEYELTKSKATKDKLDSRFKSFYLKMKIISYLNKLIHFESIHFDKKIKSDYEKQLLILDKEIDEGSIKPADLLESPRIDLVPYEKLEDFIEEKEVYFAISKLTENQKKILYLSYVKNLKEQEIASKLGVSQQAISKQKSLSLKKIRKELMINADSSVK